MKRKRLKEIWKDVPGYGGLYRVSNLGRVRSLDMEIVRKDGVEYTHKGRLLDLGGKNGNYLRVTLCKDGCKKYLRVHQLVLITFVGPRPDGMEGCHNDGIKTNNKTQNLRWGTPGENAIDKRNHGTNSRGESHGNSKFTEGDIINIRIEYSKGKISQRELAERFGVRLGTIGRIIRRERWTHI